MTRTFLVKIYVGESRPAYDTPVTDQAELTANEQRTLVSRISRYLRACTVRRAKAKGGAK